MNFPSVLKNLRETYSVTQDELARHLKVSRPTIAGYETKNRQPDYEKLVKIANFFEVSIDYLLTGKNTQSTISVQPTRQISEKALDNNVLNSYRKLALESKQDVLKYIKLLRVKEQVEEKE